MSLREHMEKKYSASPGAMVGVPISVTVRRPELNPPVASPSAGNGVGSAPPAVYSILGAPRTHVPAPSIWAKENASFTSRCVDALLMLYRSFGFDPTGYSTARTAARWTDLAMNVGAGGWLKVAKWKLAAFASHWYVPQQRIPACPFTLNDKPGVLLGGAAGRWLRLMLKTWDMSTRLSFVSSVKKLKSAMPRPTEWMLRQKALDTEFSLTEGRVQPRSVPLRSWAAMSDATDHYDALPARLRRWAVPPKLNVTVADVRRELVRTVRELFYGRRYTVDDRVSPFFPSTSANYINTRAMGGAVGALLEDPVALREFRHWRDSEAGRLIASEESVQEVEMEEVLRAEWQRRHPDQMEPEAFQAVHAVPVVSVDATRLKRRFSQFYWHLMRRAMGEAATVEPVSLAEALKIRVISKGPPMLYTVLKPLQKFMWRVLKDHPAFSLVGQPVTVELVQSRMGYGIAPDEVYLSGDYEAATDNLAPWVSETICHALAATINLSNAEETLLVRSLTGHLFGGNSRQRWGQLMGSVTSFPILCIANAAVCRFAWEQAHGRTVSLRACPLMVNGDDVLMKVKREGYRLWQVITRFIGLNESVGKTYISDRVLEINSTLFASYDTYIAGDGRVDREFVKVPCANFGLIIGAKRSARGSGRVSIAQAAVASSETPGENLGARARELVEGWDDEMRGRLMKMFVNVNWRVLSNVKVPWYMPEWIGGLGLPEFVHNGEYHGPTEKDLALGRGILQNWARIHPVRSAVSAWNVHSLVMDRLPHRPTAIPLTESEFNDYQRVYGFYAVSLLFDSSVVLTDLVDETVDKAQLWALKHNERVWKGAHHVAEDRDGLTGRERFFAPGPPPDAIRVRLVEEGSPAADAVGRFGIVGEGRIEPRVPVRLVGGREERLRLAETADLVNPVYDRPDQRDARRATLARLIAHLR